MERELTADLSLRELTEKDRKIVDVTKMEEYYVIFFNVESQILLYWMEYPHLKDKKVVSTFKKLEKNFDNHKETSLAGRISRAVKEGLIQSKKEENRSYTYGEVISCIKLLKKIAKIHKSPSGRGYLFWIGAFFENNCLKHKKRWENTLEDTRAESLHCNARVLRIEISCYPNLFKSAQDL